MTRTRPLPLLVLVLVPVLVLVLAFAFAVQGCKVKPAGEGAQAGSGGTASAGGSAKSIPRTVAGKFGVAFVYVGPIGDGGWTYAHEEGRRHLEQKLGVKVRLLADYGVDDGSSTIYSGTAFMDWAKDGEQQGLLSYLKEQAADVLDDPTITIWMHNEYDQGNDSLTTAEWLAAVKSDAALVRAALGQGPSTTPYHFVWIPYGFGSAAIDEIKAGMAQLAADPSFNATISKATDSDIAMDAGPVPGAHLGAADGALIAARLTAELEPIAKALAGGGKP